MCDALKSPYNLTKREEEILNLISSGYSSRQIARELFISINTVNTHRMRIMEKCNVHKTVHLVHLAIKLNLKVA